jgi:predicted DNA binding CopG/RHH family protein
MEHKPSLSVRLAEPQLKALRQEAERLGITVSELIRIIIHHYLAGRES